MNFKKPTKKLIIYILSFVLLNFISITWNKYEQNRLIKKQAAEAKLYHEKVMRFEATIDSGSYDFADDKNNIDPYFFKEMDNDFIANSTKIDINKDTKVRFAEYILTAKAQYFHILINGREGWIKDNLLEDKERINYLQKFIKEKNKVTVFPFNSGDYALISDDTEQYIVNLNDKVITWQRGSYYEVPKVDINSDTLKCGGDLSSNTYEFSKEGELIKTSKYGYSITNVIMAFLNVAIILLILNSIRRLLIKGAVSKVLVNIIFFTIFVVILIISLLLFGLFLAT
ncbi:hypothetical protein [Clostridium sp. 'White wine YQ']|uniref:hypothetical protein n=1 Tax=Clostridium sp. 'White wine YQ' TaxID=3027474 RepID=UPI0023658B28|nr:hypothetical protein [Clostridium sp. 'White wine YQ']MDD7794466.1 hypothetical protein [Clostridium sp. 'White wine YQ']